jgi:hypothetical protein
MDLKNNFLEMLQKYDIEDYNLAKTKYTVDNIHEQKYYKQFKYFWEMCAQFQKNNIVQQMKTALSMNEEKSFNNFCGSNKAFLHDSYKQHQDVDLWKYYWLWAKMEYYLEKNSSSDKQTFYQVEESHNDNTTINQHLKNHSHLKKFLVFHTKVPEDVDLLFKNTMSTVFQEKYGTAITFWGLVIDYIYKQNLP